MYLLDSISKNIGAPYTELWSTRIVPLFMETYRSVDQPTKRRLEELLATWREAGPGKRPLFGDSPQWTIERSLFGSAGAPQPQRNQAQALATIERLVALASQESAAHNDPAIEERLNALQQVC